MTFIITTTSGKTHPMDTWKLVFQIDFRAPVLSELYLAVANRDEFITVRYLVPDTDLTRETIISCAHIESVSGTVHE